MRVFLSKRLNNISDRLNTPAPEERLWQYPGPTLEYLYCFGSGFDLPLQELGCRNGQHVNERLKSIWIAQRPLLDDRMIGLASTPTFDHVCGHRPRCTSVADESDF